MNKKKHCLPFYTTFTDILLLFSGKPQAKSEIISVLRKENIVLKN